MGLNVNLTRRTIARSVAWGAPAVAVVTVAPAVAASPACDDGSCMIVRNLTYRVFVKLNGDPVPVQGDVPPYATPAGTIDQEVWGVVVETELPPWVPPNTALPAPPLQTTVTTSVVAADTLRTFAVTSVNGTASPQYTVEGSVVSPGARSANLVVPDIDTPATGGITTIALGSAQPETSTTAGMITQTVGKFTSLIHCTPNIPISKMGLTGALEPAGQVSDPNAANYIGFGEILVG